LFVCLVGWLLQDASGHSNVLKAGKAEELKTLGKGELPEKPTREEFAPKATRTAQAKATS